MRRLLPALLLFTAAALRAQSSCPTTAPGPLVVTVDCPPVGACIAGSSARLSVYPLPPLCPPPVPCPVGATCSPQPPCGVIYQIQACDVLTWDFGDGTTATVTGQSAIDHIYAAAGKYRPAVTISNSLGSGQAASYQAFTFSPNPPAFVNFSQAEVIAPETAGNVTFTLVRSGNLSISSTVHYSHRETLGGIVNQAESAGGDITFAPGETTKSISLHIYDDHLYTGPTVSDYVIATATDGTLFGIAGAPVTSANARYTLTEVDPQPTASISDVRVLESAGTADFVVTMSAPIGASAAFFGRPADGTAKSGSDFGTSFISCGIAPGQTQCTLHVNIVNDDVPEPDETFTLKIDSATGSLGPSFARDTATCTIVNDDAVLAPSSMQIATGTRAVLKLDVGQPRTSALTVPLQSSSPEVLDVPASVTIAAGRSSADVPVHALQAGRSRIAAQMPGMTAPPALVTVADAVSVLLKPSAVTLHPGGDAAVAVSLQPPRGVPQTVNVQSTRPDVATVPDSLTIPAGGEATLNVHGVARGVATVWITTVDGFSFYADVVVSDGPTVARIEPASASASGGTAVNIVGSGLDARCSVAFGGVAAAEVTAVGNGLSVVVPAHAPGDVDVDVVCGSAHVTLGNGFTFLPTRRRAAG